jgi:hypothetical protein
VGAPGFVPNPIRQRVKVTRFATEIPHSARRPRMQQQDLGSLDEGSEGVCDDLVPVLAGVLVAESSAHVVMAPSGHKVSHGGTWSSRRPGQPGMPEVVQMQIPSASNETRSGPVLVENARTAPSSSPSAATCVASTRRGAHRRRARQLQLTPVDKTGLPASASGRRRTTSSSPTRRPMLRSLTGSSATSTPCATSRSTAPTIKATRSRTR